MTQQDQSNDMPSAPVAEGMAQVMAQANTTRELMTAAANAALLAQGTWSTPEEEREFLARRIGLDAARIAEIERQLAAASVPMEVRPEGLA